MQPVNPYVAGNSVGGGRNFVGRDDVVREVLRVLRNPQSENALVLYGQRRIGKTSILLELEARLRKDGHYRPIYFDLQDKATLALTEVVAQLAGTVATALDVPVPPRRSDDGPEFFKGQFISEILERLPKETSLVFLFDEFDVLDNPGEEQAGKHFFPYLRDLLALNPPKLQFVFVIGRRTEELSSRTLSVFKGVRSYHVSLLSRAETCDLVRSAERNQTLKYSDDALSLICNLTGGNPILTQFLCHRIWEQAYERETETPPIVRPPEVEAAVSFALQSARQSLEWLWSGLGPAERVAASALAEIGARPISQDELERHLHDSGIRILVRELKDAPRILQDWDLIEPCEGNYRFRVELLRRWIAKNKPLSRVQAEIDRIQPLADNLFQAAHGFFRSEQLERAVPLLRQAVELNPNHLQANLVLAEILLAQGKADEAASLLESLHDYQPSAARPRLVQAILVLAKAEIDENKQLALCEQVLKFEAHQREATGIRQRIWEKQADELLAANKPEAALNLYRQAGFRDKMRMSGIRGVELFSKQEKFQEALQLAHLLHAEFPDQPEGLPRLDALEQMSSLEKKYGQAVGMLQSKFLEEAAQLFAQVLVIMPEYRDAAQLLSQAVAELKEKRALLKPEAAERSDSKAETDLRPGFSTPSLKNAAKKKIVGSSGAGLPLPLKTAPAKRDKDESPNGTEPKMMTDVRYFLKALLLVAGIAAALFATALLIKFFQ